MQLNDFVRKAYYAYFDMNLGEKAKVGHHALLAKLVVETMWTIVISASLQHMALPKNQT